MRTCGDCAFYAPNQDLSGGDCRNSLPVLMQFQAGQNQIRLAAKWPPVRSDWKACGKHFTNDEMEARKAKGVE